MTDEEIRGQIKSACQFFGGVKAVAGLAKVDGGNLNNWLNFKATMSDEKLSAVLIALGIPNFTPNQAFVHKWSVKSVFMKDFTPALKLYFPDGAKICRARWVKPGPSPKDSLGIGDAPQTLYGITDDNNVRAVLRMPRSLLIQPGNIKGLLTWKNGTQQNSELDIPVGDNTWETGVPSLAEFDRAWGDQAPSLNIDDVNEAIRTKGVTFEQAITAIKAIRKPRKKP